MLTLPIAGLATAIGFCTSYLVNKNDFHVSSSTSILLTGSPAKAKINCLAENFDFKNLTVEEAIEKINDEGVNNWLFNNISRLLDGNLDNINNANLLKILNCTNLLTIINAW